MKQKNWIKIAIYRVLSLIFILFCLYFAFMLYVKADFLSKIQKYLICCLLAVIGYFILKIYRKYALRPTKRVFPEQQNRKIKITRYLSHFLIILLCITLVIGGMLIQKVDDAIGGIGDGSPSSTEASQLDDEFVNRYYVYTSKDSGITSLDSSFKNMGVLYEERGALYNPLKSYMLKKYNKDIDSSFEFVNYTTKASCLSALYGNLLKTLIISDEMYYKLIERDPNFIANTTRIATIELVNAVESKPVNVKKTPFNVLILGVDVRENEGSVKTDSRCDTVMVASFNPKTMAVSLISIPRDSLISINGAEDKLTHTGNFGIQSVISTVENTLDCTINYYVKFNFKALVDVVNAIGGVEVDVQYDFTEQDSSDQANAITLTKGVNLLDGEQALAYARHRKTVTDSARANAQQQIIQGLIHKLVSFSSLTKLELVLNAVSSNMMTNLSKQEIYDLMSLAPSLGNVSIQSKVIAGTDEPEHFFPQYNGVMYTFIMDPASIEEAKAQIKQIHS